MKMSSPQQVSECELPALEWTGEESAQAISTYLEQVVEGLNRLLDAKIPAAEVIGWRSRAIDKLLVALFHSADAVLAADQKDRGSYAIVAQGGYGREELCYHSDIDLLFLHNVSDPVRLKQGIEKILYPLWDSGLDIGFAVRTAKECLQLMKEDLTILTAIIDARFLVGDDVLFKGFQEKLWQSFESRSFRENFILKKEQEQLSRAERFGGSVYLLEPNAKEGKGGLRDYHHIHWIIKMAFRTNDLSVLVKYGWIKKSEYDVLLQSRDFLWSIRNQLHRRSGRRTDQILFDYQAPLAASFGFRDSDKILAVEDFMRTYYRHAAECYRISRKVNRKLLESQKRTRLFSKISSGSERVDEHLEIHNGFLAVKNPEIFKERPEYLIKVFRAQQIKGAEMGRRIKEAIHDHLHLIDDAFCANPLMTGCFREMLAEPKTIVPPLLAMHELGVLERFLPEFHHLMYRVQHDVYHLYTVDIHSISAVGEFGHLLAGDYADPFPTPSSVAKQIIKRDLLSFAIFYHDIGKGEGSGHVQKGAPLICRAAERLGFQADEIKQLEFLELSHLMMPHLSFRRDLDDPNLILQFAQSMEHEENLNLLYLLTFCDIKAVSPEALTNWKESLLEQLYIRTQSVLKKGDFTKERVQEIGLNLKNDVRLLAQGAFSDEEIEQFFHVLPLRYCLTHDAVSVLDHMNMRRQLSKHPFAFHHRNLTKESSSEWTLLTSYTAGLFSKVCGVLAAKNVNILEAYLNRTNDGYVIHTFKIQTAQGAMIEDEDKWQAIEADIEEVLQGKRSLKELLGERLKPSLLKPKTARRFPAKVHIDNDLSPFYTVIDVYAHDRVGLLYQISNALDSMGLYVDISKIATKVDQVSDTFYVKDIFGHKISSEERIKKIRSSLLSVIGEESA